MKSQILVHKKKLTCVSMLGNRPYSGDSWLNAVAAAGPPMVEIAIFPCALGMTQGNELWPVPSPVTFKCSHPYTILYERDQCGTILLIYI